MYIKLPPGFPRVSFCSLLYEGSRTAVYIKLPRFSKGFVLFSVI